MRTLNRAAAERLTALPDRDGTPAAHGVTDVTGFGLIGHSWELAERSGAGVRLDASALPLYDGALIAAEAGVRTGGDARNRAYLSDRFTSAVGPAIEALAIDPQTSGGLLASVTPGDATALVADGWWEVGEVVGGPPAVTLS
jgi:selenide,water dikinase